ncbi:ABC transporter permease [Halorussus halobius]|uniref:ABC transporter permease n=1 Tax=Halorussus halobius TaxID=1710537 RepID=UPI001092374C|nr:ABC transporter permease [Halorussus halobius]
MTAENVPRPSRRDRLADRLRSAKRTYDRMGRAGRASLWLIALLVATAAFAPLVAPYGPIEENYDRSLQSPSLDHPAGTDLTGRDVLSRMIFGTRVSLAVGVGAVLLGVLLGVPIGSIGGYYGGWIDEIAMRSMDVVISFPALVLALAIIGVVGGSLWNLILVIGVVFSPQYARLIHGEVLSIKESEYVEAAEGIGLGNISILWRHVLPNAVGPVIVQATFHVALAIIIEASLSFLGLGVQPPQPTWGVMIADGRRYLPEEWWISVFPGFAIMITVLAFNLLGDGLREVYDPQLVDQ